MDWRVEFRANRLAGAQRLLNRLKKKLEVKISLTYLEPSREVRGCWDCGFTTEALDVDFSEAVVDSMVKAQSLSDNWSWGHLNVRENTFRGAFRANVDMGGTWLVGLTSASFELIPADAPSVPKRDAQDLKIQPEAGYSVTFELEECKPQPWSVEDDNSWVWVTFENGIRWVATFVTYRNIETLRAQCEQQGHQLGGRYLWVADIVIVEQLTRSSIEAVVEAMVRSGEFERAFQWLGPQEDWTGDEV
jgi:hypothetical protein